MLTRSGVCVWMVASILAACSLHDTGLKGVFAQPAAEPAAPNAGGGGGWQNMTPEQRRAMQEKFLTDALKPQGLTDDEIKVVIQFQNGRREAQAPLMQEFQKLMQLSQNKEATDEQAKAALDQYRAARKTSEATVEEARKKLDEAIHYTTRPKVEAALLLLGILDNGIQGGRMMGGRRPQG